MKVAGLAAGLAVSTGLTAGTAAALLSAMGWKGAVFEQHYTAGGYTHSYERNGYERDVGLHYIGDMDAPTMARKFMDWLSGGQLDWAPMDKAYDRFFIGDEVFEAVAGKDDFRANLIKHFPAEQAAIDRYLKLLSEVGRNMQLFTVARLLKPWQLKLAQPLRKRLLPKHFRRSTREVLEELTQNQTLIAVLTGQWGDISACRRRSHRASSTR